MKKVLVITYYWPPAGGGGVQRWVKLSKYLPQFDWKPIVLAPEGADYPLIDSSLERDIAPDLEVIRRPILEPRKLYGWFGGSRARRSQDADEVFHRDPALRSWGENLAVWLRGNLLIPDARVTWVRPNIRFLLQYLQEHPVGAVVTTGPPHSIHLIGRAVRAKLGIPWIADFRDPWTQIEYYDDMMLTGWADRRHRKLEAAVLEEADAVTTVSPTWAAELENRSRNVHVIPNGYDEDDFVGLPPVDRDAFRIGHVGSLSMDRNPIALWEALGELVQAVPEFATGLCVEMLGRTDPRIATSADEHGLKERLQMRGYVSHEESIDTMSRSAILLLLINRDQRNAPGRIPGKVFEYLAARRPILMIGPTDGDAANIINNYDAGAVYDYEDADGLRQILTTWHHRHLQGTLEVGGRDISTFSRRSQAGEFAGLLASATTGRLRRR